MNNNFVNKTWKELSEEERNYFLEDIINLDEIPKSIVRECNFLDGYLETLYNKGRYQDIVDVLIEYRICDISKYRKYIEKYFIDNCLNYYIKNSDREDLKDYMRVLYLSKFYDIMSGKTALALDIYLKSISAFKNYEGLNDLYFYYITLLIGDIKIIPQFKHNDNFNCFLKKLYMSGRGDINVDFEPILNENFKVGDKVVANLDILLKGGSGFSKESTTIKKGEVGYISAIEENKCAVDFTCSDKKYVSELCGMPLSGVTPWYVVTDLNNVSLYSDVLKSILNI